MVLQRWYCKDFKVSTFALDHVEYFKLYALLKRLMDSYALSGIRNPCRIKGPTKMNFANSSAVQPPNLLLESLITGIHL